MLVAEYGGPIYDLTYTAKEGLLVNITTAEKWDVKSITTYPSSVLDGVRGPLEVEVVASNEHGQMKIIGRGMDGLLVDEIDPTNEETLWDE